MKLTILVASMSGTAELVAEAVMHALDAAGHEVVTALMEEVPVATLRAGGLFLICTSTYDGGALPDNALEFVAQLGRERPDLSAVEYGLFVLGDSMYAETFCEAGYRLDELFSALGARRRGEMELHDASSTELPEDMAPAWAVDWMRQGTASAGQEHGQPARRDVEQLA